MTQRNSIVISSGHGKYIRGASGYLDEVDEARLVVERTADIMRAGGVKVITFHDNTSHDQNTNLNTIVNFHNKQTRDLDVSIHFNAYKTTSSPMGTECLYLSQQTLAAEVSRAIAGAGSLINRGAKKRTDLFFLNKTDEDAVLVETVFVNSKADANLYGEHFEEICSALAEALAGRSLGESPPPEEITPPEEIRPPTPGVEKERPVIGKGAFGYNVKEVQMCLEITTDMEFGPKTAAAVQDYQRIKHLSVDGVVGAQTWAALTADYGLQPYPYPLPAVMSEAMLEQITRIAINHPIATYSWRDRGRAPAGYIKGMAVSYAQALARLSNNGPITQGLSRANTGNDAIDALAFYDVNFKALQMYNDEDGINTLRHLWVLLMGLGMRESSGKHCEGRDMSATNTTAETCEAGGWQTSWNARVACTDFVNLFDQYTKESPQGYMNIFAEGVSCSSSSWDCYGSGDGFDFQERAKWSPCFAAETCAVTMRNLRQHYGPLNTKSAEIRREADDMYKQVEELIINGSSA